MNPPLIFVVDDDDSIRDALSAVLVDRGYAVEAYRNGREASAALAHGNPDLILLDWMMPEMNGDDFLRAESKRIEREAIPVIVVSAVGAQIGVIHGVREKINKPFDLDEFLAAVEKNCKLHHLIADEGTGTEPALPGERTFRGERLLVGPMSLPQVRDAAHLDGLRT